MGFIFSSEAQNSLRQIAKSAIEGAAFTAAAALALRWKLDPVLFRPACAGLTAALAASTFSVGLLVFAREARWEFAGFMKAWGAGVFIRGAGLAALMVAGRGRPWSVQGALLGSYALGVLFLLLVEYRQLVRKTG